MTGLFLTGWNFYPSVLIGFGLWTAGYILAAGPRNGRGRTSTLGQQAAFHSGTLIGLIALVSPLDELGDQYLFSAHMIQHLLLMFGTAPLWLIGTPGWLPDRLVNVRIGRYVEWITRPVPAFVVFTAVMCAWHLPGLYDLAQNNEGIHIFEHLTFIGAALIGWWPVAAPQNQTAPRPAAPVGMLYLFLLGIPMTALSAVLTFSSVPLYAFYENVPRLFGLGVLEDQRLGALLMWVPAHMVLFLALGLTFQRWFRDEERQALMLNSNLPS